MQVSEIFWIIGITIVAVPFVAYLWGKFSALGSRRGEQVWVQRQFDAIMKEQSQQQTTEQQQET